MIEIDSAERCEYERITYQLHIISTTYYFHNRAYIPL